MTHPEDGSVVRGVLFALGCEAVIAGVVYLGLKAILLFLVR